MTGRANNLTIKLFPSLVITQTNDKLSSFKSFAANTGTSAKTLCIGKCKILSYFHAASERFCPSTIVNKYIYKSSV